MAATKRRAKPAAPPRYVGAATCDLTPEWATCDPDLAAMLAACHAADPDDLTPQLVLADLLAERADAREAWVRAGCDLWAACRTLTPAAEPWDYHAANAALAGVTGTPAGWRLTSLWGSLVAWHCPAGDGTGPMGRTWADERVRVVNRCCWWWAMGLLRRQADIAGSQAYAARRQADAAGRQADAAGRQADIAGSQAYAAGRQAYAAGSQAYAAGSQADAAGSQADAAWRQAYAAWRQADAAGRQADAASNRVWRFAAAAWALCEPRLADLAAAGG
jgi:uncharacterized protein (TIGR02996 family)